MIPPDRGAIPYSRPYGDGLEVEALKAVIESGIWTNGREVERFEVELCDLMRSEDVVCVSSGTAAITAVLHLLKEPAARSLLVTSALNFVAAPACARLAGY